MDNFDLRKYLAEGRLFEEDKPVWTIEGWDDSPTIESADKGYVEAVVSYIKSTHPNISKEDLKKSMEVSEETWYNKGRENAKSGDGEDFEVSVEEFADGAIEYYEDAILDDGGDLTSDGDKGKSIRPFDERLKFFNYNYLDGKYRTAFLKYAEEVLKPKNASLDDKDINGAISMFSSKKHLDDWGFLPSYYKDNYKKFKDLGLEKYL